MPETDHRRLLGEFVRAHRERLKPAAPGGRRRTPGLRREELAALAANNWRRDVSARKLFVLKKIQCVLD